MENNTEENINNSNFITEIIDADLESGKHSEIVTRFPPEPNGYLHIGHAKSICLNFGLALKYGGKCHLRFDDTNPTKEEVEYVDSIKEDVAWLGFSWGENLFFASDYFETLYGYAVELIKREKAYVCELNDQESREYRGTLTEPGKNSIYRERSVEENLDLFARMKAGEFKDGEYTLRAKIDMSSPNINLRDPIIYRIRHAEHHRTGNDWCIYPMYDFTHGLSDAIEGITHSICTLEFENHRPLYDWFLDALEGVVPSRPRQIEFARLNLTNTVMSKRLLLKLVQEKIVTGWDDPRMPTIAGLRRRGVTAAAIRNFCARIGVAKMDSEVEISLLEFFIREDLNKKAPRLMAVLDPVKLIIDNYPEGQIEEFDADNNPEDESAGTRKITFSREIYIERSDFMEDPPKKFFRLGIGLEVRIKHAYYVTCTSVVKDDNGEITEIHCNYDPESRGGTTPDKRKVKGTIHWANVTDAVAVEVRLYDYLLDDDANKSDDFFNQINQNSLIINNNAKVEPAVLNFKAGASFQFMRNGYFSIDKDSSADKIVVNRVVSLKDSWSKIAKKG